MLFSDLYTHFYCFLRVFFAFSLGLGRFFAVFYWELIREFRIKTQAVVFPFAAILAEIGRFFLILVLFLLKNVAFYKKTGKFSCKIFVKITIFAFLGGRRQQKNKQGTAADKSGTETEMKNRSDELDAKTEKQTRRSRSQKITWLRQGLLRTKITSL